MKKANVPGLGPKPTPTPGRYTHRAREPWRWLRKAVGLAVERQVGCGPACWEVLHPQPCTGQGPSPAQLEGPPPLVGTRGGPG